MKEPLPITFREERDGRRYMTHITATLEVHAQVSITDDAPGVVWETAKERLREMIMRELYEDKRSDFNQAFMEFELAAGHPYSPEFFRAKDRLFTILKRMQPEFAEQSTSPIP